MPAGNPVINTASSFPLPIDVGLAAPALSILPGTLVADSRATRGGHGGADQRTAACDSQAQTRTAAGTPRASRPAGAAATRSSASAVAAVVVVAAVVATVVITNTATRTARHRQRATTTPRQRTRRRDRHRRRRAAAAVQAAPPIWAPTASTRRRRGGQQAASQPAAHRQGARPTRPQVSASMSTNQGNIGLQLDNAKSPCTVNSFASLAQQGYFNDTPCHRLTTSPSLAVLQCGDPTGPRHRRPGLPVRQRVPDQPVPARRSRGCSSR